MDLIFVAVNLIGVDWYESVFKFYCCGNDTDWWRLMQYWTIVTLLANKYLFHSVFIIGILTWPTLLMSHGSMANDSATWLVAKGRVLTIDGLILVVLCIIKVLANMTVGRSRIIDRLRPCYSVAIYYVPIPWLLYDVQPVAIVWPEWPSEWSIIMVIIYSLLAKWTWRWPLVQLLLCGEVLLVAEGRLPAIRDPTDVVVSLTFLLIGYWPAPVL